MRQEQYSSFIEKNRGYKLVKKGGQIAQSLQISGLM